MDRKAIERVDHFINLGQKISFPRKPIDESNTSSPLTLLQVLTVPKAASHGDGIGEETNEHVYPA